MISTYVSSSNISRVGWDHKTLYVEFNHGGTYAYKGVDFRVYAELIAAESTGEFFHRAVRYKYCYAKLDHNPFTSKKAERVDFIFMEKLETKKMRLERLLKEGQHV